MAGEVSHTTLRVCLRIRGIETNWEIGVPARIGLIWMKVLINLVALFLDVLELGHHVADLAITAGFQLGAELLRIVEFVDSFADILGATDDGRQRASRVQAGRI